MLATHWMSEFRVTLTQEASGRKKDEWAQRPNHDNELFDCFIGCAVAASVHGLAWSPDASITPRRERRKLNIEEAAKRGAELPAL